MPPTVMTPWFTTGCRLCVWLVAAEPLPAEPACAPELAFPPEALFPADPAPLLRTFVRGGALPLLGGVSAPDVAPVLGVPVPELLPGEAVEACPATPAAAGWTVVAAPRCAKSYAIAPPRASVAMTFSV